VNQRPERRGNSFLYVICKPLDQATIKTTKRSNQFLHVIGKHALRTANI
jgi:hypothetical protein